MWIEKLKNSELCLQLIVLCINCTSHDSSYGVIYRYFEASRGEQRCQQFCSHGTVPTWLSTESMVCRGVIKVLRQNSRILIPCLEVLMIHGFSDGRELSIENSGTQVLSDLVADSDSQVIQTVEMV